MWSLRRDINGDLLRRQPFFFNIKKTDPKRYKLKIIHYLYTRKGAYYGIK